VVCNPNIRWTVLHVYYNNETQRVQSLGHQNSSMIIQVIHVVSHKYIDNERTTTFDKQYGLLDCLTRTQYSIEIE